MTKVLMTADAVGGVWTYAIELTRALPEVEFVVATMGTRPSDAQRAELPANVQLVPSTFRLEWMDNPWDDVANAGYWLLDLEATHRPDIVHLNGYTHAAWPFSSPKLVVAHSCVLSWWRAVKGEAAVDAGGRYQASVERGLQAADLVVAPSKAMLHALHDHYRFDAPSRVIYNGRSARPTTRTGGRRQTVFAAGRLWDDAKNLRTVVQAAPDIRWPVHIAGEGGAGGKNITHHGQLDAAAMQERFDAAGIYLFPALYEPFGLSILEAALAGSALVIGDIDSLREIWGEAALYVPPRDVAAVVATTNALIGDDRRREEMARRAQERAQKYTPQAMANAYREVYARLRPPATRHPSPVAGGRAEARP